MTSDANAKLPIPTYDIREVAQWAYHIQTDASGRLICKADDVRGLVERMSSAERHLDRLKMAAVTLRNAALAMNRTQAVDDAIGEVQSALVAIDKEPTT